MRNAGEDDLKGTLSRASQTEKDSALVRVPSPSKDHLQEAIGVLREHDFSVVQFGTYRC